MTLSKSAPIVGETVDDNTKSTAVNADKVKYLEQLFKTLSKSTGVFDDACQNQ